jgi:hypothetical protein
MTDETPLVDAWSSFNALTPPLLQRLADLTMVELSTRIVVTGRVPAAAGA